MARIAVISADHARLQSLLLALREMGHELMLLGMDQQALDALPQAGVDLVILYWRLNDRTCAKYLGILRRETDLSIFVLTSAYEEAQTVAALRAGADACISLPISATELNARIAAQLRRYEIWSQDSTQPSPSTTVYVDSDAVVVEGRPVELSVIERRLLERLQEKSGVVVTRDDLCGHVWGTDGDARYTNLSLAVYNLRRKLERNPHHPRYLLTKWGVGYYLSQEFSERS